jgi:hypothetical protein
MLAIVNYLTAPFDTETDFAEVTLLLSAKQSKKALG